MNFGEALALLKEGKKVARKNWNGNKLPDKNLFIYYVPAGAYTPCTEVAASLVNEEGLVPYLPYIAMKTVDNTVVPWLASQTDILSEDWYMVE